MTNQNMSTAQTLIRLIDAHAFFMPGSNEASEYRQALLTALEEKDSEIEQWKVDFNEMKIERDQQLEELIALRKQQKDIVPQEWTNLLAYVLQDDMHNRFTPRIVDIAYNAFMLAKRPNIEDGGPSDWFNDTKPKVTEMIQKLRKDLIEELDPSIKSKMVETLTCQASRIVEVAQELKYPRMSLQSVVDYSIRELAHIAETSLLAAKEQSGN